MAGQNYTAGELYHYGVKGQKWGVRRYQNKDGSLTPAGKERYDDSQPKKSKRRLKLEEKYRNSGMSPRDAELTAAKRIKAEKIIAAAGAVALTAAVVYAANKHVQNTTDKVLKSGMTLQRITSDPNENLDRAFYTSHNKTDNLKYRGLYGMQLSGSGKEVHKFNMVVDKDVRIASRSKAADTFADLYTNDPEFRETFTRNVKTLNPKGMIPKRDLVMTLAGRPMSDAQLKRVGYDAFNVGLADHSTDGSALAKKFYDRMKSQGYDAIMDVNDKKYSGYRSKAPVIVFNNDKKVSISSVKKLTDAELAGDFGKAYLHALAPKVVESGAAYATYKIGSKKMSDWNYVNAYRREHPNSGLTDKEILKTLNV